MLSSEEREGTMKIGIIGLGKVGSAFLKACAVTAATGSQRQSGSIAEKLCEAGGHG